MSNQRYELNIDELVLEHVEVKKKTVKKYVMKYVKGDSVKPVQVTYCIHSGEYFLADGHHRVVASSFLGRKTVTAEIDFCYFFRCRGFREDFPKYTVKDKKLE